MNKEIQEIIEKAIKEAFKAGFTDGYKSGCHDMESGKRMEEFSDDYLTYRSANANAYVQMMRTPKT